MRGPREDRPMLPASTNISWRATATSHEHEHNFLCPLLCETFAAERPEDAIRPMTCTCPPPDGDDPECEFHGHATAGLSNFEDADLLGELIDRGVLTVISHSDLYIRLGTRRLPRDSAGDACWCGHGCGDRHDYTLDVCPVCRRPKADHDEDFNCPPDTACIASPPSLEDQ